MLQVFSRAEVSLPLSMLLRLLEGFEFDWHRLLWFSCAAFVSTRGQQSKLRSMSLTSSAPTSRHRYDSWPAQAIWAGLFRR